jgi:uncharacterized protein (TIGR02594 family)
MLNYTLHSFALRFIGLREISTPGHDHPFIQWCHSLCNLGFDQLDEVPWCSSIMVGWCWMLTLPNPRSAMSRSWLPIGRIVQNEEATVGFDVVVMKRGDPPSGHVGIFCGWQGEKVYLLGGNQSNSVNVSLFPKSDILGIRRLM